MVLYRVLQVSNTLHLCKRKSQMLLKFSFSFASGVSCFFTSSVSQIGGATGMALAIILFFGFGSFSSLFTDDPAVLGIAKSGVWVMRYLQLLKETPNVTSRVLIP